MSVGRDSQRPLIDAQQRQMRSLFRNYEDQRFKVCLSPCAGAAEICAAFEINFLVRWIRRQKPKPQLWQPGSPNAYEVYARAARIGVLANQGEIQKVRSLVERYVG
jgi:hypothetical protein